MDKIIKNLINELLEIKDFDLKTYYNYIEVYGKEIVLTAFDQILLNSDDFKSTYIKYFAAYFSIKLENLEITDNTYLELIEEYGEETINKYFNSLLEVNYNPKAIKQKYEKIYFYMDAIENSKQESTFNDFNGNLEDSVRLYLKDIGEHQLLTPEEEAMLLQKLNESRKSIVIAGLDDFDNINFIDCKKLLLSIKTKEQYKKLKKILEKLPESEDKKLISEYIDKMKKVFKETDTIDLASKKVYKEKYLNEQLDAMIQFVDSREKLITSNLRLVVSIAKYYSYAINFEILDLISEGNIGLMRAIKKFDCEKRTKLSTYATWWIRQAITRYIADNSRTIRIPVHYDEKIRKYIQATKLLTQQYGENISDKVLAEHLGWSELEVANIKKVAYVNKCISLDTPIGEDDDTSISDMIADERTTEDVVFSSDLRNIFEEIFETLTEKEREILKLRYDFNNTGYIHTLEEVGKIYGVTRERVRQIEAKTLRKLRHVSKAKKFKGYI